jgi:hypothetical protein
MAVHGSTEACTRRGVLEGCRDSAATRENAGWHCYVNGVLYWWRVV